MTNTQNNITSKNVLVIDDEIDMLDLLVYMLKNHYNVIKACGGQAALDLLKNDATHFDVVISDFNMPDVSGTDIYHYLAEHHADLAKRMIFTTGGVPETIINSFFKQITNPYIEKPYTRDQLLQAIDCVLQSK
jgi:DNA-binding NtrC family response regulator